MTEGVPVRDGDPVRGIRKAFATFELSAPLHPILVHFTIALTSASLAFDLIARVFGVGSLSHAAWWILAASVLVTAGTIISGIVSRIRLPIEEGLARSYLRGHMALGPMFFGALIALTIWRADLWYDDMPVSWWYLGALALAVSLMTVQGYLGGELVYRWGADVSGRYRALPVVGEREAPRIAHNR